MQVSCRESVEKWGEGAEMSEEVKKKKEAVEKTLHREAFEYYYALGGERSLAKVAEKFGKAERTVWDWSSKYNWQERVQQYDLEAGRRMREQSIQTVVEEKANYRKIIKTAIGDFLKRLRDGEVKVTTVAELEKLIKLDLTLMGEATEISRSENTHGLTEQDREMVRELVHKFKEDLNDLEDDE